MAHKELICHLVGVVFSPARATCHPPHQTTAGEESQLRHRPPVHAVGCTGLHGTGSRHDVWPDEKHLKYLIENHCSDQAQKAETVLSAVSLIFVISIDLLDQYQYLGNCPPTPPLAQQQSIDNKLGLMLG